MDKGIAVILYQDFSLVEITCLTYFLGAFEKIDFLAAQKSVYFSEDGFRVEPSKTFDEVSITDYRCIILPGTNPIPVLYDEDVIGFLQKGVDCNIIFAAISSAPLLLCKAGLLKGKRFTAGIFAQMLDLFDFIEKENFSAVPVVEDGNVITAMGMFYREFAQKVLDKLGYDYSNDLTVSGADNITSNDLVWSLSDESLAELLDEIRKYSGKQ